MIGEGIVQHPTKISFSDGDVVNNTAGKSAEQLFSPLHEALYYQTYFGHTYHGYNTTATTLPITTTTAPTFILWNPYGSGVNVVPVHLHLGYADNTNVDGNVLLGVITNAGSSLRTGGVISAFTNGPTCNGKLGAGHISGVRFGIAATLTNAATKFFPLGLSLMVLAKTGSASIVLKETFDGSIIIPPGNAIFICDSVASVSIFHQRLCWYEFPE